MPRNKRITYEQQIEMGLVKPAKGFRSATDLGLPVEQQQTAIEPAKRQDVIYGYMEPDLPAQHSHQPPTGQMLKTSHKDRTDAYVRRVRPITIIGGMGIAFAAVVFDVVPLWSLGFVAIVLMSCLACLMIGEIIYQLFSPDGIGIFSEYLRHRRLNKQLDYIYNANRKGGQR